FGSAGGGVSVTTYGLGVWMFWIASSHSHTSSAAAASQHDRDQAAPVRGRRSGENIRWEDTKAKSQTDRMSGLCPITSAQRQRFRLWRHGRTLCSYRLRERRGWMGTRFSISSLNSAHVTSR